MNQLKLLSANPFCHKLKFTKKVYLRMLLMLPIGLCRITAIFFIFILLYLVSNLCYLAKLLINQNVYHKKKKYLLFLPLNLMKLIFFFLGVKVKKIINYNKHSTLSSSNIFIFAPHSSMLDVIALIVLDATSAVARYETQNIWMMSRFVQLLDLILVKRENPNSRLETIKQIKLRSQYEKIAIFSEGTCTNQELILKFRLGAFSPGLPIQPVYIEYDKTSKENTIWTFEGPNAIQLFILTVLKWKTQLTLHLLPVYCPSQSEIENSALYASNMNKYFCEQLGLRQCFYNFEDPRFLQFTRNKGIPRSAPCLKLVKLCYKMLMMNYDSKNSTSSNEKIPKKKNSIGSINSINKQDFNWILELELILNQFIETNLNGLSRQDLSQKIDSLSELVCALNLKNTNIKNSNTVNDFYCTLKGQNSFKKLIYLDLFILLKLCDTRTVSILDRIKQCLEIILKYEHDFKHGKLNENSISLNQFRHLVWCLLSLEKEVLPESIFNQIQLDFNFFKLDLVNYFRRAVEENANDLLEQHN